MNKSRFMSFFSTIKLVFECEVFAHFLILFKSHTTDPVPGKLKNYVIHYDGTQHNPVTSTPIPGATPTPEGTPPPAPYIPGGYGYTHHVGIDYSLQYEPVLAAASGEVIEAGWTSPANHRIGYGLHVVISHLPTTNYETWYGHLSTLTVKTDDNIVIDPNDPGNRNRILGISGNTGAVFNLSGSCENIPTAGPACGQHLHFEVRTTDVVVNPYGWVALACTPDPWNDHPNGETSYDLWTTYPAVESYTDQYPGGNPLIEPSTAITPLLEIDDASPNLFTTYGNCWTYHSDVEGVNGGYYEADVDLVENINNPPLPGCYAEWTFDPEFEAPSGDYDVYVHVPDYASTLHAYYTVRHNGQTDEAVVVQAAYPPYEGHEGWAYIGRYDFGLNGSPHTSFGTEYIQVSNQTISETASIGTVVVADAVRLLPIESSPDLEITISQSSDDAGGPNQRWAGNCSAESIDLNEIYLGHCENGSSTISGFRFQNVVIPEGSIVTAARLEFTVDTAADNVIDVQFQGELTGNAATFSSVSLPSDRDPLTNAVVSWHIASDGGWQVGTAQTSPDLSAVIQEVIAQPAWSNGNAIVIIMQPSGAGTAARRVFGWDRYGGNPLQSAKLQIWYTEPPPLPPAPTRLRAVYEDGGPTKENDYIPYPPRVVLTWSPISAPTGTTFNVYRGRTILPPIPLDAAHRIASGLTMGTFYDFNGQLGDMYVVTAVTTAGESDPSNTATAR